MNDLKSLPAPELIRATEKAVQQERSSTAEVVRCFQEIYDRKFYLERGFPSFFEMVTKQFGYCAGAAQRRINSMRLIRDLPEVEKELSRRNPQRDFRESVRHLSEDRLRISLSISTELNKKLARLKNLMSHSKPCMATGLAVK